MLNRTILGKFISRKFNDKVFWTICLIINQKQLWKSVKSSKGCRLICSFTKTNTLPQMMQIIPNPSQRTFSRCLGLFFQVPWKFRYFQTFSFRRRWKYCWYFHYTPIPASPKIPFVDFFIIYISSNMQTKRCRLANFLSNFQLIKKYCNLIWQEDLLW